MSVAVNSCKTSNNTTTSMDEYADRYFETTLKCLSMNMPDLFNVDLSHHDLTQGN